MIVFTWELIPIIIGFFLGLFLYNKYHFRAGGVIVLPLLAIYFVKNPFFTPYLILVSIFTFFLLEYIYGKHIIYGRRLMYLSLILGITMTLFFAYILNATIEMYGLLVPGLLAYNIHRERNSPVFEIKSLAINTLLLLFLIGVSFFSLIAF